MITVEDTSRRTPGLTNVRISGYIVRRRLRESGLRARRPVIGPIRKQCHRTTKLTWARAHRRCRLHTWQHILFVMNPARLGGVMVWTGVCHDGRTQGTLNAVKYRDDILDPTVLLFLQLRNFDHVFEHDNARFHVDRACQDILNQNHNYQICHQLNIYGMNSVDRQNPPETLQELRDALVHGWNNIPQAVIQRLFGSMRRRCEAVVAARGIRPRY